MKAQLPPIRLIAIIAMFIPIIACNNSSSPKDKEGNLDTISTIDSGASTTPLNSNTIDESAMKPYSDVDSLTGDLKSGFNTSSVLKLESICNKSDGDLTEKYYEVTKYLFTAHLSGFINFMLEHPNSCLQNKLIEGISADLSIFEGGNRIKKIKESQDKMLRQAIDENLSRRQVQVINDIYNRVNPSLFD